MKPISLKLLARELNLSVSTVSRALNDRDDIAQETKDRARKLATKLKYEPNPYASSLRSNKSKTIGIVIPEIDNHFFSLAINGIEEIARANDYHVLISLTHEEYQQEKSIIQLLAGGRVDGLLLSMASTSQNSDHLAVLEERKVPVVFFDRVCEDLATARVTTDDYESGYRATTHLLEAGCRKIAHLAISGALSISRRRLQGYADALRDAAIAYDQALVLTLDQDDAQATDRIRQLLAERRDIDGVFAAVEALAMHTYAACRQLELTIPEDVKVIGFSNLETAPLLKPALTTITQPAYQIGKQAAQLLFKAINDNVLLTMNHSLELKSELHIRMSTYSGE
ncbi:LacI family DNA-binding transcriptional regulator [Hymenobacter lucidus]|uniref:LacI family transcriptional regulator n=1 Tax=Hymenobacter lucidus TaxID=2880930 RepID=A0ABS8AXJ0_9BACT|nr:LacI family DNA-binding transcriptional regulator [Hymenobacter lucidus]MCB2410504.1 LacI family transcriptional regulator [Hymenobacter lucidus]